MTRNWTADDIFKNALAKVLKAEGYYSNDPNDPGNWTGGARNRGTLRGTKYGISAASYPNLNIKFLTLDEVTQIYRRDFWDRLFLNQIAEKYSPKVADMLFNFGVNCGPGNAVKFLQRSINALVIQEGLNIPVQRMSPWQQTILRFTSNKAIKVDGLIGPITLKTLHKIPHPVAIASAIFGEAYNHYARGQVIYRAGWFNRIGFSYLAE